MKKYFLILIFIFWSLIAVQAATVKVSWNANTESDLAGYKIYYGTVSGTYGDPIDVGNVTEDLITITPETGTTYYFVVTAYDTSGNESDYSEEATCFVSDGTAPEKPTGIKAIIQEVISWFKGLFGISAEIAG